MRRCLPGVFSPVLTCCLLAALDGRSHVAACDADGDGQVSLYEWRIASGQTLDRFRALDRNDDGFLTIQDVQHWQRETAARAASGRTPVTERAATPKSLGSNPGP